MKKTLSALAGILMAASSAQAELRADILAALLITDNEDLKATGEMVVEGMAGTLVSANNVSNEDHSKRLFAHLAGWNANWRSLR